MNKSTLYVLVAVTAALICATAVANWTIEQPGGSEMDHYATFVAGGHTDVGVGSGVTCICEVYKFKTPSDPFGAFLQSRAGQSDGSLGWTTTPTNEFDPDPLQFGEWPENVNQDNDIILKLSVGGAYHHERAYDVTAD
jgi:hypothetical protein